MRRTGRIRTKVCVMHPERTANITVQGILVCAECDDRYQRERYVSNGVFLLRPFLRSLIAAYHQLPQRKEREVNG